VDNADKNHVSKPGGLYIYKEKESSKEKEKFRMRNLDVTRSSLACVYERISTGSGVSRHTEDLELLRRILGPVSREAKEQFWELFKKRQFKERRQNMRKQIDIEIATYQLFEVKRQRDALLAMVEPYKDKLGLAFQQVLSDIQVLDYEMNNKFEYPTEAEPTELQKKLQAMGPYARRISETMTALGEAVSFALTMRDTPVLNEMKSVCLEMFEQADRMLKDESHVQ
jgi:hypothetical protein